MAGKVYTIKMENDKVEIKIENLEPKREENVAVADPSYSFKWWIGDTILNFVWRLWNTARKITGL